MYKFDTIKKYVVCVVILIVDLFQTKKKKMEKQRKL